MAHACAPLPPPLRITFPASFAPPGTVDWTVHECVPRGGQTVLSEAVHAEGGLLGSTLLDRAFMAHLRGEVGEQVGGGGGRRRKEGRGVIVDMSVG